MFISTEDIAEARALLKNKEHLSSQEFKSFQTKMLHYENEYLTTYGKIIEEHLDILEHAIEKKQVMELADKFIEKEKALKLFVQKSHDRLFNKLLKRITEFNKEDLAKEI